MKLAVIGDIHGFWDATDSDWFNQSDYDGVLFVGDLPRWTNSIAIARQLSRLTLPAWLLPGNHDGVTKRQLLAEIKGANITAWLTCGGMAKRTAELRKALLPVQMVGFSLHPLQPDLAILAARPHAMGPNRFHFRRYLSRRFDVDGFDASSEHLKRLIDAAPKRLIMLAHNGPHGLGAAPDAPFGCDFNPALGDFGDPDLKAAMDYARASGREVLAVVAGHMHHRNAKTRAVRRDWAMDGDILCINAAHVPRVRRDGSHRHHICLTITPGGLRADTVFVSASGVIEERLAIGPLGQDSFEAGQLSTSEPKKNQARKPQTADGPLNSEQDDTRSNDRHKEAPL